MGRLDERVAIITGAGQGIGLGIARTFAAEGARVVVANRNQETGRAAVAGIERDFAFASARAHFVRTDVSETGQVEAMVDATLSEFGRLDILVNNATPTTGMARLEKMTQAAMEEHIRVNYYAAFQTMQAAFPHMRAAGYGRVINLCSLNGIHAHKYTVMYNGSKEALRALTRTAAAEWGRHGITCNVLCPAAATPPWEAFLRFDPAGAQGVIDAMPMGRMGDAEADVGPVALFLAAEESRYVTGNTLHADGGGHIAGVPWHFEPPE